MNKNKKILVGIVVSLIALVAIGLLINSNNPTGAAAYGLQEVDLAINTIPNSALVHIAQEKGYFTEQGLKVNYHAFATGKLALDALIGGGADIATTADVPITLAALADQKISVVATIEYSTDNIQVVARKDAGINKPSDLSGKRIATTKGGGPMFFADAFITKYKIKDAKIVYLTPPDMITSLVRGDIDAFIVFEPSPSIAIKQLGTDKVTVFSDSDIYGETWNIVVMKDFENSDTITKFIKALVKAEEYYTENPEDSIRIVSDYSGVDLETTKEMLQKQNIGVVLNNVLTEYLQQEAEWAIKNGLSSSERIPDFDEFINTEYLKEINPKVVEI
ncbi:MAG TPA: NrtA/SsuA/CpmA family ABC transporter substrate-binding protein [Candidatus Nanoarchaeia archaeon]|nr:NrtA/SsuA/CpmA family ABC transporter substrate-binding protein [Candidatus Nanoarchaeia archaeon]